MLFERTDSGWKELFICFIYQREKTSGEFQFQTFLWFGFKINKEKRSEDQQQVKEGLKVLWAQRRNLSGCDAELLSMWSGENDQVWTQVSFPPSLIFKSGLNVFSLTAEWSPQTEAANCLMLLASCQWKVRSELVGGFQLLTGGELIGQSVLWGDVRTTSL